MEDVIKNGQESESFMDDHPESHRDEENESAYDEDDMGLDLLLNDEYLNSHYKKNKKGVMRESEDDKSEHRDGDIVSVRSKRSSGGGKSSQRSMPQHPSSNADDDMDEFDALSEPRMRSSGHSRHQRKKDAPKQRLWEEESDMEEDGRSALSQASYVSRQKKGGDTRSRDDERHRRGSKMTPDDILSKKQELLFELDRFEQKGKRYFRRLTISSSLEEIKTAYEKLLLDCELDESIQSSRRFIIFVVTIIENVCTHSFVKRYLPFELRLSGWSQCLYLEMEKGQYDNVFKKLYIKYRNYTLVSPEVELMWLLFASGMSFHIGNMFLNNFPMVNDTIKSNPSFVPQMMNLFTSSAAPGPAPASAPHQTATAPSSSNGSGGGGGGAGMSNLFGMIGTALNMFTGNSGSAVQDVNPRGGGNATPPQAPPPPPPMPMPRQMKGPGNVDNILEELQQLDQEQQHKKSDAVSEIESDFSDLPEDMSLSGVFSTKKGSTNNAPSSSSAAAAPAPRRGRPAKTKK